MQISPVPGYFIFLRPKFLPQYPIFQYPQPIFFPHFDGEKSARVENSKIYSSLIWIVLLFWRVKADRPQIIDRIVAGISRI